MPIDSIVVRYIVTRPHYAHISENEKRSIWIFNPIFSKNANKLLRVQSNHDWHYHDRHQLSLVLIKKKGT